MSPDSLELMDGAVAALRAVITPALAGEARYAALLTANAVATARRDAELGSRSAALKADSPAFVNAIRSGAHDEDPALYQRLVADAVLRAYIADPSSVTEAERAAYLQDAAS